MSANVDFLGYGRTNETLVKNIDRIKKLLKWEDSSKHY
jgi:hypothetical protein